MNRTLLLAIGFGTLSATLGAIGKPIDTFVWGWATGWLLVFAACVAWTIGRRIVPGGSK